MSAPFRIRTPRSGPVGFTASDDPGETTAEDPLRNYLDRLIRMIPTEVVGLYLVGNGVIPTEERAARLGWPVVCLAGLIALRAWGSRDPAQSEPVQWTSVLISAIAFVIWIYTLGGPFELLGWHKPYLGSLMVLVWTFFVPIFYKGDPS